MDMKKQIRIAGDGARLVAKQAEKIKLLNVSLPAAYRKLGEEIYKAGILKESFEKIFSDINFSIKAQEDLVQTGPIPSNFIEKLKVAAKSTKNIAVSKKMEYDRSGLFSQLGRLAYEGHRENLTECFSTKSITENLKKIAVLDQEIAGMNSKANRSFFNPKIIAISLVGIVVLALAFVGYKFFLGISQKVNNDFYTVDKITVIPKEKEITIEPIKKESSGKEDVIHLGKGVKLEMVLIPAGKFKMGSPLSEKGRRRDETQHEVTLTKPFYMGKYEVTQEQWEAVMGNNPSTDHKWSIGIKGAKLPVTNVSWEDCQEFIKKLNENIDGGFRLPTEAEWEYACRGGTTTVYSYGDSWSWDESNNHGSIEEVGKYKPNVFGLYDMHGNVFEWCEDWKADLLGEAATDPKGPSTGETRVFRGGSFSYNPLFARSAARSSDRKPTSRNNDNGFRLARTKDTSK